MLAAMAAAAKGKVGFQAAVVTREGVGSLAAGVRGEVVRAAAARRRRDQLPGALNAGGPAAAGASSPLTTLLPRLAGAGCMVVRCVPAVPYFTASSTVTQAYVTTEHRLNELGARSLQRQAYCARQPAHHDTAICGIGTSRETSCSKSRLHFESSTGMGDW